MTTKSDFVTLDPFPITEKGNQILQIALLQYMLTINKQYYDWKCISEEEYQQELDEVEYLQTHLNLK